MIGKKRIKKLRCIMIKKKGGGVFVCACFNMCINVSGVIHISVAHGCHMWPLPVVGISLLILLTLG